MSKCNDLTGRRFGRLTIIERDKSDKYGQARWLCKCDCGNEKVVGARNLVTGIAISCGCLQKETVRKTGFNNKKHGDTGTRLHHIWLSMRKRCGKPQYDKHNCYFNKGISICSEWSDYQIFKKWALENGYNDNLSIDRINNNGDYEPFNCRWATILEQNNNQSQNIFIEYNGETKTLGEWSRITGKPYHLIHDRIVTLGWDAERAFTELPNNQPKYIYYNGEKLTLKQWSKKIGIDRTTLHNRIYKREWSVERAFTEPVQVYKKEN